jgi:hypothetical protein
MLGRIESMGIYPPAAERIQHSGTALKRNLALRRAPAHQNGDFSKAIKAILAHDRASRAKVSETRLEFCIFTEPSL